MTTDLNVGNPSAFLKAIRVIFRLTGMRRGGSLIDIIPNRLLGSDIIWAQTDAGPLVLRVPDTGTREFLLFGHPQSDIEETKIVCALLPLVEGMMDIGANYGWYTKLAANLMKAQTLKIALEANPEVAACLRRSLSGLPNVRVVNAAATDRARTVTLYRAESSGLSSAVRAVGVPIAVQGLALDDVWPADQPLGFVKCDVEGGELDVLRGARRIRRTHEPVWMLEFDEQLLVEANVEPAEVADEVSDMLCWWRSDRGDWVLAENLTAIPAETRTYKNVFLVPHQRATQFAQATAIGKA
jgi:FkbM family methyltransferase